MATVSDIKITPLSGQTYIDALLNDGPDWNYLTPVGNTITYTFSVASGNEANTTGQQALSAAQQAAARTAIAYIASLTGIQFVETTAGTNAQLHLANLDIAGANVTGQCSWTAPYEYSQSTNALTSYTPQVYVYLDNNEWRAENQDLTPGGQGYETLLHELGHAMGLKHPFDDTESNTTNLPVSQDNTSNTLMSYTEVGGPYSTYRQDDIAALYWLYGGDGLRGALGINSTTGGRYLMGSTGNDYLVGTSANDVLEGDDGIDTLDGGAGTDTAVFRGARSDYSITQLANGDLQVTCLHGKDGSDTLHSIETLKFSDLSLASNAIDNTPPVAPTLAVTKNANGYTQGSSPTVTGGAEAGSTVNLYWADKTLAGTVKADASGLWSIPLGTLKDGLNYQLYATATDSSGNTSVASTTLSFNVDAHAPVAPTASLSYTSGSNQATVSGTGEAGTTIYLVRTSASTTDYTDIASTVVAATGKWTLTTSPLPNGAYQIATVSSDLADNSTSATGYLNFTVSSTANLTGTTGNDKLVAAAGNNAIDGQGGIDTAVYAGARANYTLAKEVWGYGVTDNAGAGGHDSLINVERVQFADAMVALDVDGTAGIAYRLYQAAFDRVPDQAGLGYWIWRMDNGSTMAQVAAEFINQPEFVALYGASPTSAEFVTHLYNNVLHRAPEGAGYDYWMDALANQHVPREQVLALFSESPENQAQVIGSIQNGFTYTPWAA